MFCAVKKIKGAQLKGLFVFAVEVSRYQALEPQFISTLVRMLEEQLKKTDGIKNFKYRGFKITELKKCLKILKIRLMIRYSN